MFFERFFKKSKIKLLLGGGIIFRDGQDEFYIDSNTEIGLKNKNVIIFKNEIRKVIGGNFKDLSERSLLTDLEKNQVALKTKTQLEKDGATVIISPPLPLNFSLQNK